LAEGVRKCMWVCCVLSSLALRVSASSAPRLFAVGAEAASGALRSVPAGAPFAAPSRPPQAPVGRVPAAVSAKNGGHRAAAGIAGFRRRAPCARIPRGPIAQESFIRRKTTEGAPLAGRWSDLPKHTRGRRTLVASLGLALLPWTGFGPARADPPNLACPRSKPTESGCVSSLPSGAPNQNVAPLRYRGERPRAYSRLRACLLARSDAELLEESPDLLRVRLPSLEASQPGLREEVTFRFLPDEPIVTLRIKAERPYPTQPFCVTPGCIVGNAAQRKQLESIRDEVGFSSTADPATAGKWVPIFFNNGIDLSAEDD